MFTVKLTKIRAFFGFEKISMIILIFLTYKRFKINSISVIFSFLFCYFMTKESKISNAVFFLNLFKFISLLRTNDLRKSNYIVFHY